MTPLRGVLADPGAIVMRRFDVGPQQDEIEPLIDWQARAVAIWLREHADVKGCNAPHRMARYALQSLADKIERREA